MSSFADHSLSKSDVARFSRQLILTDFGARGQEALKNASVLVVGAGGLGCPVCSYLAAAGIGRLGIIDYDKVSIDNLHRQTLHDEQNVGKSKVDSIKEAVVRLNSNVKVETYNALFTRENAFEIAESYDIIADCSDNVTTRYLVNDVCILAEKPLVSGSAIRWEGQLTVYGNGENCPCYRCLFPSPPPPETVVNCSEGGVLGPVTGVIGSMQALEVMKIAVDGKSSFAGKMFLFDGLIGRTRTIKLRARNDECAVCGKNATVTELQDYPEFCKAGPDDEVKTYKFLENHDRITPREYQQIRADVTHHVTLVDIRDPHEFEICHLPEAINMTLEEIQIFDEAQILSRISKTGSSEDLVFVMCHRGNESQLAVILLRKKLSKSKLRFYDIIGGLDRWAVKIDPTFPQY